MKRGEGRLALILLAALLLSFCAPAPDGAGNIPDARMPTAGSPNPASPTPQVLPIISPAAPPQPTVLRAVIISIDGLRPEGIDLAPMPVVQGLIRTGAYSLRAQTILPSTTLPSHSSMLTGSCPSEHGVWWNTYLPEMGYAAGTDLFDVAHEWGLRTAMVVGKEKLRQVTEPASTDVFEWVDEADPVIARKAADVMGGGFSVLFVHLRGPDQDGHASGWLSAKQLEGLRETDEAVRIVLEGLDAARMREGTLIILTADHGGHGTTHGTDSPEDMTIPWIINGPGVVPGRLASAINTTDTAATIAWALELPLPEEWTGSPVLEAFGIQDEASRPEPRCL